MGRFQWSALYLMFLQTSRASFEIHTVGELYLTNADNECKIAIPMIYGIAKLGDVVASDRFRKEFAKTYPSMCVFPPAALEENPDEAFESKIKLAVLNKGVEEGTLLLDCEGIASEIVISYIWRSRYTGSLLDTTPALPLYDAKSKGKKIDADGTMAKFQNLWRKQPNARTLKFKNLLRSPNTPDVDSKAAYAYCRALFKIWETVTSKISALPFPVNDPSSDII
jgi:hypothetical protein